MPPNVIEAFNAHAVGYDGSLEPILVVKDALHALIRCSFSQLPDSARILVAGAGTGAEVRFLAPLFRKWHFTLVDPSEAMLNLARGHASAEGFADRCEFHVGFVSSLERGSYDAATSVLVSHFLTDRNDRRAYFESIAQRLKEGGSFFNADLCADPGASAFESLMGLWLTLAAMPEERKSSFSDMFGKQVAAHGPGEVEAMIANAGFSAPAQCFQLALVRGWVASRVHGVQLE